MQEQEFDDWNKTKKELDLSPGTQTKLPKEREVWIIYIGKNIGSEQGGAKTDFSRPVLVLKKFSNEVFWILPLSTKQKENKFYYNFTDIHNEKVSVILSQLKLISIKRFKRKMYDFDSKSFSEIKNKVIGFLK